jgi:hypothetical protein
MQQARHALGKGHNLQPAIGAARAAPDERLAFQCHAGPADRIDQPAALCRLGIRATPCGRLLVVLAAGCGPLIDHQNPRARA